MNAATVWKILRSAWRIAPIAMGAIIALLVLRQPPAGSSSAPGQVVTVAGEQALTKPARKWKKRRPSICEPAPGDVGGRFKVQTREPSAEELERLARQYGFTFGDRELSANLASMPMPAPSAPVAGASPEIRVARMLGEYAAPALRYGGTFASGLIASGELETRYDPAPAPRLAFPLVWGGGVEYDATAGLSSAARSHRIYGLFEPIQTKQVYWRVTASEERILDESLEPKWDLRLRIGAEWRSEPWVPKNRRGLRAVKLSD